MSNSPGLSYVFARDNRVLLAPFSEGDSALKVQYCDDTPPTALLELRRVYALPLKLEHCATEALDEAIGRQYQEQGQSIAAMGDISDEVDLDTLAGELPEAQELLDVQDDAPVIRLINALFAEALKSGASDIHIETYETSMSVRLRLDGILQEVLRPPRQLAPLLVSRIKVMAKLDIAEKRVPQDGRVSLRVAGRAVDVRISTIPSNYGERVVMRLLDKQAARIDLAHLGMPSHSLDQFSDLLRQPNGILLVTGPTGSGKTTTLYAGLSLLNDRKRNILTVEDPVEYAIEGIGQTQVNNKVGMSFARGLRAILRQDPDVVMVGEIRDFETAEIAVQASLTGHMVLSTLHTNTAVGAITRLRDIGVESYLIASSLKGVLAQRLVRKLCNHCKTPTVISEAQAQMLSAPELAGQQVYQAQGCEHCHNTGYQGRVGLYELLRVDGRLRELIHDGAGEQSLLRAVDAQLQSLLAEGQRVILEGLSSIEEVLRCVREDSVQEEYANIRATQNVPADVADTNTGESQAAQPE